jgi:heme exporter protein A
MNNVKKKLVANKLTCSKQNKILFENISFELAAGDVLLVQGPNGSGKSSLLKLLSGLATPSHGTIFWQDKFIRTMHTTYFEHLHYIGHTNGIKLGLSVLENLRLLASLSMQQCQHVDEVLVLLQLDKHQRTLARYLSAGQKRRVALAALFISSKSVWILDEPYTALDATTQNVFMKKLEGHLQSGGIAIISSHHPLPLNNQSTSILRLGAC